MVTIERESDGRFIASAADVPGCTYTDERGVMPFHAAPAALRSYVDPPSRRNLRFDRRCRSYM